MGQISKLNCVNNMKTVQASSLLHYHLYFWLCMLIFDIGLQIFLPRV